MLERRRPGVHVDRRERVGGDHGVQREDERLLLPRHAPPVDELGERGAHRLPAAATNQPVVNTSSRRVPSGSVHVAVGSAGRPAASAGSVAVISAAALAEVHERVAGGVDLAAERTIDVGELDDRWAHRCAAELDGDLALHAVVAGRHADQQVVQPDRQVADDRRGAREVQRAFAQRDALPRGVLAACHDVGGCEVTVEVDDHPVHRRPEARLADEERRRVERQLGHRARHGVGVERVGPVDERHVHGRRRA